MQSLREFNTLHENLPCHAHHTLQAWKNLLQHTHTNGSGAETREACRRNILQVKELDLNNEKLTYFCRCRADDAVEGEQEALSILLGAEFHTGLLLGEQRNQILLAARCDIIMQVSGTESADDAIRELNRQVRDHRMENPPYRTT